MTLPLAMLAAGFILCVGALAAILIDYITEGSAVPDKAEPFVGFALFAGFALGVAAIITAAL